MSRQTPVQEVNRLVRHTDFSNPGIAQMQERERRGRLSPDLIKTQEIPAITMAQEVFGQTEE
jgi:hypothetical protein